MTELKFITQKKSKGIYDETGYYLNGKFLDRYKSNAIEILRDKITKAGNGSFEEGKNKAKAEWEAVNKEYIKSCEATEKIRQTKKPYWDKLKILTLRNKISRLKEKIDWINERKQNLINEFEEKIVRINNEIEKIEERIQNETENN